MSRIGKLPIALGAGRQGGGGRREIRLEGPKGKLETRIHPGFTVEIADNQIQVKRPGDTQEERAVHGLMRKLIANMARA